MKNFWLPKVLIWINLATDKEMAMKKIMLILNFTLSFLLSSFVLSDDLSDCSEFSASFKSFVVNKELKNLEKFFYEKEHLHYKVVIGKFYENKKKPFLNASKTKENFSHYLIEFCVVANLKNMLDPPLLLNVKVPVEIIKINDPGYRGYVKKSIFDHFSRLDLLQDMRAKGKISSSDYENRKKQWNAEFRDLQYPYSVYQAVRANEDYTLSDDSLYLLLLNKSENNSFSFGNYGVHSLSKESLLKDIKSYVNSIF